jgi:hypothetical protein
MADDLAPFIAIPAFALGFPAMWCGVCFLLALMGGWRSMASRYRYQGSRLPALQYTSARLGVVNYRGVLRVGADTGGLYLAVMVLFRVGHPALCVPWSAIGRIEKSTALLGLVTTTTIAIADGPTIVLYGDWTHLDGARP